MKVIQCWDDGVTADIRLTDILRRFGAKATFNLSFGVHPETRENAGMYSPGLVVPLSVAELREVYDGFVIAGHSLTHPHLEQLTAEEIRIEIEENRKRLQDFFQQPVDGFAYPFGTYDERVIEAVRAAGHAYGRTIKSRVPAFPAAAPFELHTSCHFKAEDFWNRYEQSLKSGVFYFWGHSFECRSEEEWADFEERIRRIDDDPRTEWSDIMDFF